jgi:hypothetical protein
MLFVIHKMQYVTDLADLRNSWYKCIVYVRSKPYSQFAPQFNRENLQYFLKHNNMKYLYMGREFDALR